MIVHIDIDDASRQFALLLERACRGEEFVVCRAGTPIARLLPPPRRATARRPGRLPGRCGHAFDDALPDAELDAWHAATPNAPS